MTYIYMSLGFKRLRYAGTDRSIYYEKRPKVVKVKGTKITLFWDVKLYSLVDRHHCFKGTYQSHLQSNNQNCRLMNRANILE